MTLRSQQSELHDQAEAVGYASRRRDTHAGLLLIAAIVLFICGIALPLCGGVAFSLTVYPNASDRLMFAGSFIIAALLHIGAIACVIQSVRTARGADEPRPADPGQRLLRLVAALASSREHQAALLRDVGDVGGAAARLNECRCALASPLSESAGRALEALVDRLKAQAAREDRLGIEESLLLNEAGWVDIREAAVGALRALSPSRADPPRDDARPEIGGAA